MIAALAKEGVLALRDPKAAIESRVALGLTQSKFIVCMLVASAAQYLSMVGPELVGITAAIERSEGSEPAAVMLVWPVWPTLAVALLVATAAFIWQGPRAANGLARLLGGQRDMFRATVWVYLAFAINILATGTMIIAEALLAAAGTFLFALPKWLDESILLAVAIVCWAAQARLAHQLFHFSGNVRGVLFSFVYMCVFLGCITAVWLPLAYYFIG